MEIRKFPKKKTKKEIGVRVAPINYPCMASWQDLQMDTSHSMGSFPMFFFAYFK